MDGPQWADEVDAHRLVFLLDKHWIDPFKVESIHKGTNGGARIMMDSGNTVYFDNPRDEVAEAINEARRKS